MLVASVVPFYYSPHFVFAKFNKTDEEIRKLLLYGQYYRGSNVLVYSQCDSETTAVKSAEQIKIIHSSLMMMPLVCVINAWFF